MTTRDIVFVGYDGVQILDITGPAEVFAVANRFLSDEQDPYRLCVAATHAGELTTSGGLGLVAAASLADVSQLHTLVVAGGLGVEQALGDAHLIGQVGRLAGLAERVASVCTGAFVLGALGLLDGRRAVTHWHDCALLAALCPEVTVVADAIFVRDGHISTSAGVTAGIDLALALVEEDHGRDLASRVARQLVVFLQRPGGQSQFSSHLSMGLADRGSVRDVQAWIADHLTDDLSVPALAARAGMSTRNFARVFPAAVGTTPGDYVERVRVEAAKQRLETSTASIAEIARSCGFGTPETMHRAFRRRIGTTPGHYRGRFARQPTRVPLG